MAHALQHIFDLPDESAVLREIQREATTPSMKAGLEQILRPMLQDRQLTMEQYIDSLDVTKGWVEDGAFCLLAAVCMICHVCVITPTGAWCTTQTGSGKFASVCVLQCLDDEGSVVFVPVEPCAANCILAGGELIQIMTIKIALVRTVISNYVKYKGDGVQCQETLGGLEELVMQNQSQFVSPWARIIMKEETLSSSANASASASEDQPVVVIAGEDVSDRLMCKHCRKLYKGPKALRTHIANAHGNLPYICKLGTCCSAYATKESLHRHIRGSHGIATQKCDQCDKSFLQKNELLRHKEYHVPYSDRKYVCKSCPSRFTSGTQLKRHSLSHVSTKMCCPYCDSLYKTKEALRAHIRAKHTKTSTAFQCRVCGKILSSRASHARHKKQGCKKNVSD